MLTAQEVAQHSTRESCWIIIAGQVYDVTDFLDQHAGGPSVILRYAGRDATEEYEPTHSPTALQDNLPAERRLGPVDPTTVTPGPRKGLTGSTTHVLSNPKECPSLSTIISLQDFEARASRGPFLGIAADLFNNFNFANPNRKLRRSAFQGRHGHIIRLVRRIWHVSLSICGAHLQIELMIITFYNSSRP